MMDSKKNTDKEKRSKKEPDTFDMLSLLILALILSGIVAAVIVMNLHQDALVGTASLAQKDLPAYRVIESRDLNNRSTFDVLYNNDIPTCISILLSDGIVSNNTSLVGKYYTMVPVDQGQVITKKMLQKIPDNVSNEGDLSSNNFSIICIPATPTMTLNGSLQAGDVVDIKILPNNTNNSTITLNGLLVMDIKEPAVHDEDEPYLLILAMQKSDEDRFYKSMNEGKMKIIKNMSI